MPGSGLMALSAFLSMSRHRRFIYWALGLTALGVTALIVLSLLGGVGGDTWRSTWWLLFALPYPVGWIMSLLGAARLLFNPSASIRRERKKAIGGKDQ
jgi:hypothetical protein